MEERETVVDATIVQSKVGDISFFFIFGSFRGEFCSPYILLRRKTSVYSIYMFSIPRQTAVFCHLCKSNGDGRKLERWLSLRSDGGREDESTVEK